MHTSDKVQGFYFLSYQLMVLKFIADLLFILKAYLLFRFNGISWLISIARESETLSLGRARLLRFSNCPKKTLIYDLNSIIIDS